MIEIAFGLGVFCVAGFVQGCTGFGMALMAAPCLMMLWQPERAVPAIVLMSCINTFLVALHGRGHVRLSLVGPLAVGGICGARLGIYALRVLDPVWLKVGVGVFVFVFAVALLKGWRRPLKDPRWSLVPVGVAGGFLGGSTSMGGPPVILFLANQGMEKDAFRGNISCYFFIVNCFAIGMFVYDGLLDSGRAAGAALYLPAVLAGTYLGVKVAKRVPEALFRKIVMMAVAFMGMMLIVSNVGRL